MENGMDILETVMQNSLGSSFGNNSEFQNNSNQQPNQSVSITIYTDKRNFRTPKEMRDLHGSVEGVIILDPPPPANKVQRLELSLVPSEDTIPSQHMIHPNVPYLSFKDRYNSRNKKRLGTSLISAKAWKIILLIQNGTVTYVDEENSDKHIHLDALHNGNQIVLGRHHLEMTIITPLLSHKCKEQNSQLHVESIIQDRCQFDKNCHNNNGIKLNSESIIKQFVGKDVKDEMKRIRLRACLYQDETDNFKCAQAISTTICDTKNKNFGNFEIATISKPHGCCNKGGWQTFLVSKTKVDPNGFHPMFVLSDDPENPSQSTTPVQNNFPNFQQISPDSVEVIKDVFIFDIPSQEISTVQALKQYNQKMYLTLYRESNEDYATNMVEFNYEICNPDSTNFCPFCAITNFNGYDMTSTSPGGNNKQRKRSSNIRRTRSPGGSSNVLQVPQRKRSVSGSSRGSSPGREGSYHSSDQSNGISNVLLQVPQRKRSVSGSSRGSSPGREGSYHSSLGDQFNDHDQSSNGISNVLLQVPPRKRSCSGSSRGSSPVGSPVISRMNSKMEDSSYNYQSNGGRSSSIIPNVQGSNPEELNFQTYSAFATTNISSTSNNMTFFHVSDDPTIQISTFHQDEASGFLAIPQSEEPTLSDAEADELMAALDINPNSNIPDGINGNHSGILEFLPDGLIDLGVDLNIPSIVAQSQNDGSSILQRDGGVNVNSDEKE